MIDKDICFDLKAGRRRPALVMFNCLVLTKVEAEAGPGIDVPGIREALELESADTVGRANGRFDEETNLYLSNLLAAFSNPTRIEHLKTYLSAYDIGAFRRLARSADGTLRYSVYKTDRDFVLLSVGAFDASGRDCEPMGQELKHGNQGQMGRGDCAYHFAFACCKRGEDLREALGGVLENLSIGLEKYVAILSYVKGEVFNLGRRLADGQVYHLVRSTEATARRLRLERMQNEFLDAYTEWRRARTEEARTRVVSVADELRRLDPTFTYNPE